MKPPKFKYLRPTNYEDALHYLENYGDDAKIISGGQSLIPLLNMRLSTPEYLIDISRLKELNYIRKEGSVISIGASTKQVEVEDSDIISLNCPLLSEGIKYVGHPQTRSRGTVGGSIAHADPSSELTTILTALRGELVIASAEDGERVVSPEEFFLTYMLTALDTTELVKEVRFPCINSSFGCAFIEVTRRHGDFALVNVAAVVDLDQAGKFSTVQLAVGGAGPTPIILEEVEEFLIGKNPTDDVIKEALQSMEDYLDPEDDLHGSKEYRIQLASVLTERALQTAIKRIPKELTT